MRFCWFLRSQEARSNKDHLGLAYPKSRKVSKPYELLHEAWRVVSKSTVQAAVLFSHQGPVASRNVVETHRKLHHASIERQENVQHSVGIGPVTY